MPSPIEFHSGPRPKTAANASESPLDFELIFRAAPSLLLVLEAAEGFRILEASNAYLRSRRTTRQAIVGRPFGEAFPPGESRGIDAGDQAASLERVLATGTADSLNTPVFAADGTMRYIIHRLEAIELEVLRSARERDEAIRELEAAKEELEAFAHSFERLARIEGKTDEMASIIEGLLDLSRAESAPIVRKIVDVGSLSQRIVGQLQLREPHRRVATRISERCFANADEILLEIVMKNLLANAWKHTAARDDASIEVGCREVVGTVVFHVTDNGAGFDAARAHELFKPSSRLHGHSEFEGRGIGLATVRRIVERHGGQIWADARPGEGATFNFTLS